MSARPYGSIPPPAHVEDVAELQQIVRAQHERMVIAQGDIRELKDLARRLNKKYETEQKRLRQLQEDIVLANARARNISLQNEDMRQRLQHIEAYSVEQRHVHTVQLKSTSESIAVALFGAAAIAGMLLLMLYAVTAKVG
jgi:chromosome segregation ATPase